MSKEPEKEKAQPKPKKPPDIEQMEQRLRAYIDHRMRSMEIRLWILENNPDHIMLSKKRDEELQKIIDTEFAGCSIS